MTMTEREKQADALRCAFSPHAAPLSGAADGYKQQWLAVRDAAEAMFAPKSREPFGPVIDAPLSDEEIVARLKWSYCQPEEKKGWPRWALEQIHRPVPKQYRPKKQSLVEKYGIADEDFEALRKELGE